MVNDAVPADVGVPLSAPVEVLSVTPAGRLPAETDHVYGVRPPEAARGCEYPVPVIASGNVVVEIDNGATMSSVSC